MNFLGSTVPLLPWSTTDISSLVYSNLWSKGSASGNFVTVFPHKHMSTLLEPSFSNAVAKATEDNTALSDGRPRNPCCRIGGLVSMHIRQLLKATLLVNESFEFLWRER